MSINHSLKTKLPRTAKSRRKRVVALITLMSMCLVGTSLLAQVGLRSNPKKPAGDVSASSFSPSVPSKEMIYAGTKLVATDEPCIPVSACLMDDTNNIVVTFNPSTGAYIYCCNGSQVASGTGTVTGSGCSITIDHVKGSRTVHISADGTGQGSGSAYIVNSGVTSCQITDSNMSNNICSCP